MPEQLISFRGAAKSFTVRAAVVEVVSDIDLDIAQGEIVTILGPSGCGKSTLLNMIAGVLSPSAGTVHYRGQPVDRLNLHAGYMTQADHLLPWRTVAANIRVPLELKRQPRSTADRRVRELLSLVGLEAFAEAYPSQISGGMRKRAVLARLLAQDPETMLMDEPFVALDAQMRLAMQTELRRLCRMLGKTVLFVTHDVDEAAALGDRCVVFTARPGRIATIVPIGLPADRDLAALRQDVGFARIAGQLWGLMAPHAPAAR